MDTTPDGSPNGPNPPRPRGVSCLLTIGYLGAVLALLMGTCNLNEGRRYFAGQPRPGPERATNADLDRSFALGGLLETAIGLTALILAISLARGRRWAYLAALSLVGLLLSGFLALAYRSITNDDPERSPGDMNWLVWLPLSVLMALILPFFAAPSVRRYFRNP